MSMWCWVISPFYEICSFWSITVNIIDKQLFFLYIYICCFTANFSTLQNWSMHCINIAIFWFLKMATAAILNFRNHEIILAERVRRAETIHHATVRQNWSIPCEDNAPFSFFFQDGGHLPSWICLGHIWAIHRAYSLVSITSQNLVMIDAVVSIIWTFQCLCIWLENTYSRLKVRVFMHI